MALLQQIVTDAIVVALIVALTLCALIGAAVAWRPGLLKHLRAFGDRRVSGRRATRSLDIPRSGDRVFYRHHRKYGAAVVLLAILVLYVLVFGDTTRWQALFPDDYGVIRVVLVDWARIVLWLTALFALIVGTAVFVRPSALKGVERAANRWVTMRPYTYPLERTVGSFDQPVTRHPRAWGMIIACASLVTLVALVIQWATLG